MQKLFTIGYEGITIDALVRTLKNVDVNYIIDVRAIPLSRKAGFSKNKLAGNLKEANIQYINLKGLGTPAEGRLAARKGKISVMERVFQEHMRSEGAQVDLGAAIKIAANNKACLLCFEHLPNCCHRRLVANDMGARQPFEIVNLDPQL